ncbi:putative 7-carboxy-7-deazaguanine synthase QueE [Acetobacterium sp.]|uniref:putative 7-carboxy-7-deazaguanine synthase QueE n=1 Tax=Acetobacterium sp. TaxID=1872094 RepID=UPI002F41E0DF
MKVIEIFDSIEGEGKRTGQLATFIRLAGCNLRCSYCDTTYSYDDEDAVEMTIEEIISRVTYLSVTVTGGEPLIHKDIKDLVRALCLKGCQVNIETNGSVYLGSSVFLNPEFDVFMTMDYKCPSSKMEKHMELSNLTDLRPIDVLKFVVGSIEDLDRMREVLSAFPINAQIYISAVFGKIELDAIVEYMKAFNLTDVKLQIQMHKIVYPENMRGV